MSWKQAQNSDVVEQLPAAHAVVDAVEDLHHRVRHVADMVQAPVDHERREEELEQQREAGLFGGR